uniref:DUF6285 domain-containing protein n=1 Tax=Phenylobacterium sp. TaxID=1871053 RepID=UPI0037C96303
MITHPTANELVASVALWLEQIRPTLDPRNAFLARVAGNALATVGRELADGAAAEAEAEAVSLMSGLLGRSGTHAELNAALCEAIRTGAMSVETPGLLDALTTMARR